jgi:hypothetical protein
LGPTEAVAPPKRAARYSTGPAVMDDLLHLLLQALVDIAEEARACDQECRERCGDHRYCDGDRSPDGESGAKGHGSRST